MSALPDCIDLVLPTFCVVLYDRFQYCFEKCDTVSKSVEAYMCGCADFMCKILICVKMFVGLCKKF